MFIDRVTITGADDNTDPQQLLALSQQYPFVEWGILFSKSKMGQRRYPTLAWVDRFKLYRMNSSAHFCGFFAAAVINEKKYHLIHELPSCFKRVQINYNFSSQPDHKLFSLVEHCRNNELPSVILQYNNSNEKAITQEVCDKQATSNIHLLYDSSGGRGMAIGEIKHPFDKRYTGYAGGINKSNIEELITVIYSMTGNHQPVWIDIETGARDSNDQFDLKTVDEILSKLLTYKLIGKAI